MCQDAGQRCREAEAIGQHVLGAGLAEFGAEELLAVEDLADDALGIGRIDVALFPCRSGGKPAAFGDVLLHLGEIGRVVFLHHAVAIGAAEVEDVVRVLFEQVEIKQHRVLDVLADGGGVLPAPSANTSRTRCCLISTCSKSTRTTSSTSAAPIATA